MRARAHVCNQHNLVADYSQPSELCKCIARYKRSNTFPLCVFLPLGLWDTSRRRRSVSEGVQDQPCRNLSSRHAPSCRPRPAEARGSSVWQWWSLEAPKRIYRENKFVSSVSRTIYFLSEEYFNIMNIQ